ncbi:MAG: MFS transporter [Anaerolineales bacterium]
MKSPFSPPLHALRSRFPVWRNRLGLLLAGGRWTAQLPASLRRSLRWLVVDGLLANISDPILGTYQSVYLLALGATRAEIGLLSSLSSLSMPVAMVPAGRAAARSEQYKGLIVISALLGRLFLLGLILLPFLYPPRLVIFLGIGFAVLRMFLLQFLTPAWTAMIADLVPAQWRGRYFSTRNILTGAVSFLTLLFVGFLIDRFSEPITGYQVAFAFAMVAGLASSYAFWRIEEPAPRRAPEQERERERTGLWARLRTDSPFLVLCGISTFWSFVVNISSPFFFVFLADEIGASAATLGLASAVSTLAAIPAQRLFGSLADRKGAAWVRLLTGCIIPLTPALWTFMRQPWHSFPLQVIGGFAWAGYNLAAFNLLLEMTPEEGRPSFVAFFQAITGLGMAAGAAFGGVLADGLGYRPAFLISAGGRLLATLIFAWSLFHGRTGATRRALQLPGLSKLRFRKQAKKECAVDEVGDGTESVSRED